jgi:uncharacterized protein
MKIVIPGGSGQVGTVLARAFQQEGHHVTVLGRHPLAAPWPAMQWDGATLGEWTRVVDGCDAVINLAGRNVNCRYSAANRKAILESRVFSTRAVGQAIAQAKRPPRLWLQASTATIYSHRYDAPNDERTGIIGGSEPDAPPAWKFSIDVARAWERELDNAAVPRTRKVALRSAMTMSPGDGGIFGTLLELVRRGLGGSSGDGRQFVSWVHHEDFVRAIYWLMNREDIDGVVNICSPNPLPNADFMRVLREAWGVSVGLPASNWMLRIGAVLMRTETELILKSRRVVPGRLLDEGFSFRYPLWTGAARDLCRQTRLERATRSEAA